METASPKAVVLAVYCLILSGVIAVGTNSAHACHSDGNCAERYQAVHGINWISATADEVRQWHKDGGELNATGEGVGSPLIEAASQANIAAVKTLLELGADVNAKADDGRTPLHFTALEGHAEVISILVKAGANVNAKVDDGDTPLHWAAYTGHAEVIAALVKAGANVNAKVDDDRTPLHFAAWRGHAEVIAALVKAGANVNAKDDDGRTPLHLTALKGHAEVISILVKAGADVNNAEAAITQNYTDEQGNTVRTELLEGETPLHIAARKNKISVIRALITAGADVNATNGNCQTPWDLSKGKGEALIEKAGGKPGNEVECV